MFEIYYFLCVVSSVNAVRLETQDPLPIQIRRKLVSRNNNYAINEHRYRSTLDGYVEAVVLV